MRWTGLVLTFLAVTFFAAFWGSPAYAQAGFSQSVQRYQHGTGGVPDQVLGRDFWFAPIELSGDTAGGSYYLLYVASPTNGTVHVQLGAYGSAYVGKVRAMLDTIFRIPTTWVMGTSGVVEEKAIHVWSTDADLTCHFMSHEPYSSDGSYILPTISWGNDYVVAGYGALFQSPLTDNPSEFTVVASQNNTRVTITPSADVRSESSPGTCCNCLFQSKGNPLTVVLDRGCSVQFKTTCVQDCDNFDLTGTVISANNPIGVISGSDAPNIPCDFPYANHICDMLLPIRSWGKTYYSVPFFQGPSIPPSHTSSTFLVITTVPGQIVSRYDNAMGQKSAYFIGSNRYDTYYRNDIDQGSVWTSDTPFLLVQYINSSLYPDNQNGQGNPAEVVLQPVEQYTKSVLFQLPSAIGNQSPYVNYVNIIAKPSDKHVMLDGISAIGFHAIYIDGIFTGYRASNVQPGTHIVTSDSGVGVYCYGYGYDESYAWAGTLGVGFLPNSKDTSAPLATVSSTTCQSVHVALTDSGVNATKLFMYHIDTIRNMTFVPDTLWITGDTLAATYYDATVINPADSAMIRVNAYDMAGNWTTITSSFSPTLAGQISPKLQQFGSGDSSRCTYLYDTLVNAGVGTFSFLGLHLARGDQGFSIDSAVMTPLAQGEHRAVKICFRPQQAAIVFDTLQFSSNCGYVASVLTGNGGATNFTVTDHDFDTTVLGASVAGSAYIINLSQLATVGIDSVWVDNPWNFQIVPNQTGHVAPPQFSIPLHGADTVQFQFTTQLSRGTGPYKTNWHAISRAIIGPGESGMRTGTLTAFVSGPPASVAQTTQDALTLTVSPNPAQTEIDVHITGARDILPQVVMLDVLGRTVAFPPPPLAAGGLVRLDVSSLPDGVYYLRASSGGATASKRFVISR